MSSHALPCSENETGTVYALSIAFIAAVYIGLAVSDGRPKVIAVEYAVAGSFLVLAAVGVTGSAWLVVLGFAGHGLKDLWQERYRFVANTTIVAPVLRRRRFPRRHCPRDRGSRRASTFTSRSGGRRRPIGVYDVSRREESR